MPKLTSREIIGKQSNESREKVRRYIRLTELIPELLKLVDNSIIKDSNIYLTLGVSNGVELSYFLKDAQRLIYNVMIYEDKSPSHAQTIRLRRLYEKNKLNFEAIEKILDEEKGNQHEQISFNKEKIVSVLPKELLKRDKRYVEHYIVQAITYYNQCNKKS